ncbi:hypothetical protein L228DRAFT_250684 [Xylona heveae TC161]|uniref:Uncharacterized protein n=1 Tax=Xylona heveae (strain CBS 132557 / TC161) TaxID=1328760 RepID=A0A164ZWV9_XYLHT|nr:hypothetical protein L228DRAFT_250684 [Xylona heveae TC161]KZF19636.1 hypothetical protein L228DRAFT_250684 [Xylona heveae TC161]
MTWATRLSIFSTHHLFLSCFFPFHLAYFLPLPFPFSFFFLFHLKLKAQVTLQRKYTAYGAAKSLRFNNNNNISKK